MLYDAPMTVEPNNLQGPKTITLTTDWGVISLTLASDTDVDYNIADVIGDLIRPALLAAGYAEVLVNAFVPEVYY